MAGRNSTIYDVAKMAGVSPATVSRVLNEPSRVQVEKRTRVMAAIAELKFVPRADAVANARRQYRKVGVIAPFFTQPSFMQRLRGISSVLSGQHYELVIYTIESSAELDVYVDMLVSSKRVDGLIVLCLNLKDESLEALQDSGLPVCFVEADVPGFDSVVVENYQGGRLAAEHLYKQGFRTPAFIGDASSRKFAIPATDFRLRGFSEYFKEKDVLVQNQNIWVGEFVDDQVEESFQWVTTEGNRPDCIFTSSDMIGIRFIRYATSVGLRIPDDIAVIGFDDLDISEYVNLSTVSQSLDESGKLAAEMVLGRIKDPTREPRKVIVPLKVMERESTGALVPEKIRRPV